MRSFFRTTLLIAVVLLVPVLPLLVMGLSFQEKIEDLFQKELSAQTRFGLIVVALSSDILLPIPSSAVSTFGGGILGTWPATLASWLGMTIGAVIGFAMARALGRPFAARRAGAKDLDQMAGLTEKFGPLALVLTRALPILAEACVLLVGATSLSWRRFLVPVVAANFVVSVTYASFGEYFEGKDALPVAVIASGAVPLALAVALRRWLPALDSGK